MEVHELLLVLLCNVHPAQQRTQVKSQLNNSQVVKAIALQLCTPHIDLPRSNNEVPALRFRPRSDCVSGGIATELARPSTNGVREKNAQLILVLPSETM